jgi:hypothetical protein
MLNVRRAMTRAHLSMRAARYPCRQNRQAASDEATHRVASIVAKFDLTH